MQTYLALLRGVNVGGKSLIKMETLRQALALDGLADIRTYIQSGNVLFQSDVSDTTKLARQIEQCIAKQFGLDVSVAVFSHAVWRAIVAAAPKWWGKDTTWKHNLLVLLDDTNPTAVIEAVGTLKPDIETLQSGKRVVYQSLSFKLFGRTSSGKLASLSIYKKMTIRNYNTATKLLKLLDDSEG